MNILGLFDGAHDAGACVVADGCILAAVNEERLTRVKLQSGMPTRSIEEVLRLGGLTAKGIDLVVFGSTVTPQIYLRALRFAQKRLKLEEGYFFTANPTLLQRITDYVQFKSSLTALRSDSFVARAEVAALNVLLRKDLPRGLRWKPIRIVDHHLAHAAAAHFTSGNPATLCVTADGVGDGNSMTVCECRGRDIQRLWQAGPHQSFAWFYALITIYLGFMPYRHEGKVVGLAGYGDPERVNVPFPFQLTHGEVRYTWRFGLAAREFLSQLDGYSREDLAAWLQTGTERCVTALIRHWLQKTGLRDVVLAGGLFANVKLNQRIHEIPEVQSVYVFPQMGDGGLAVGGALAFARPNPTELRDVYLGREYSADEIALGLRARGLEPMPAADLGASVAKLLAQGKVVARFAGRMEYGPRALGNRSILAPATNAGITDQLNRQLQRSEFMPFAPSTLAEFADQCYERVAGAESCARFMTITLDCTPWTKQHTPAIVHVDGTARPQLVSARDNPSLHRLLTEYRRLTGLPTLINTSFNIHEEPIVCSPPDAVDTFLRAHLDYLAIGPYLVARRGG